MHELTPILAKNDRIVSTFCGEGFASDLASAQQTALATLTVCWLVLPWFGKECRIVCNRGVLCF